MILLTNIRRGDAEEVIDKLSQLVEDNNQKVEHDYRVSFSSGVVEFSPEKHEAVETLLHEGDELMYERKRGNT